MRLAEVLTAVAIIVIAALAMADSFRRSGWTASGPDTGFYPFWSAAVMGAAALVVLVRSYRMPSGGAVVSREGATALVQLVAPLAVGVSLLSWLGFYVVSGLYMALFARWIGRYPWLGVLVLGLGVPLALYLTFERGFRVPLPKSLLYSGGVVPF